MEPAQLGPYSIGARLGRGGMGAVYEAVDSSTGATVAVKVLAAHLADDPGLKARFRAEIDTLKSLRHPGIVQLLAFGEEGDQPYFAMELVRGKTIEQQLRGGHRFTWQETVATGLAVTKALKVAHDHGIVHRDLKPSNILLADGVPIGEGVKLADFGIAKLFGGAAHTAHGNIVGTAEYMAPEQAAGQGVDHRADLYALGLVMYAMLAGRPPFRGGQVTEVIEKQRHTPAPRVAAAVPAVPPELDTLIDRLLQKDPAARPGSALALARLLTAIGTLVPDSDSPLPAADKLVIADHAAMPLRPEKQGRSEDFTTVCGAAVPAAPSPTAATPTPGSGVTSAPPAHHTEAGRTRQESSPRPAPRPVASDALTAGIDRDRTDLRAEEAAATTRVDTAVRRRHTTMADLEKADRDRQSRDQTRKTWLQTAMAMAIAVTVLGGGWMLLRPPTADTLYAQIKAVTNDDDGDLRDADVSIQRFLTNFPHDPRAGEVAGFERTIALDRLERRSRRKVRGDRPLSPVERDYRAAMAREQESPSDCVDALSALLTLYAKTDVEAPAGPRPGGELEDDPTLWIALTHRQIARLTPLAIDEQQEDGRRIEAILSQAETLQTEAAAAPATAAESLAKRRRLLESAIQTYAGRPHAKPLLGRVTDLLAAPDEPPVNAADPSPGADPR
jgi:eukaryotic-like serine/threonine-protein kinase